MKKSSKKPVAVKPHHRTRYPWATWFAMGTFVLRRGHEFDCMTHCMSQYVRTVAARMKITASIRIHEDRVIVTVLPNRRKRKVRLQYRKVVNG